MQSNGTPSPFVTLISSDDFEFHVRRSAACVSGTIRRMLDPQSMITNILHIFRLLKVR
jgi:transcription elongation factor B subunit 1